MKNLKKIMCIALGIVLLLVYSSCNQKSGSDSASSEKMVVLDFYATWCGPCKAMAPIMDQMEEKYGDKFEFKKIDIDKESDIANKYDIRSIPTIVILSSDNKVVERIEGYRGEDEMDEKLSKLCN